MNYIDKLLIIYYKFLNNLIQNKVNLFIYLIIIFIFLYLGYFVYTKYIKENIIKDHILNYEFIDKSSLSNKNNAIIVYWYTNWCPHCKSSKNEWKKFEEYLKNTKDNKYKNIIISPIEIDCDKFEKLANIYEIDNYPTITLFYKYDIPTKDNKIEYDALIKKEHLVLFIDTFLDIDKNQ
tara:strand:- start:74 stop:610 length:537 start_codon:yes stop_codon:yes gene_type:complete